MSRRLVKQFNSCEIALSDCMNTVKKLKSVEIQGEREKEK